jgi:hypothetical protein
MDENLNTKMDDTQSLTNDGSLLDCDDLLSNSKQSFLVSPEQKIIACVSPLSIVGANKNLTSEVSPTSISTPLSNPLLTTLTRRAHAKSVQTEFPHHLSVGSFVDIASQNVWCVGQIQCVFSDKVTKYKSGAKSSYSTGVTVSYVGWSSKYNEDITDQYKIAKCGTYVSAYKAWINLPGLPPWPCIVYDRQPVRNNTEAIEFLKSEFKLFVQLCGTFAVHMKPYSDGFWYDKKCIFPFSSFYNKVVVTDTHEFKDKILDHWHRSISSLRHIKMDSYGITVEDFKFQFDGTFQYKEDWYNSWH